MTVEEIELEKKEETVDPTKLELEAEKKARYEAEAKAKEAELKAARAEGEAEVLKRGISTTPQTITEDQWRQMEEQSGLTRQQIEGNARISGEIFKNLSKPLQERAESAEKEARQAREEARRNKVENSTYKIEREFYDKHPELTGRRAEVDRFMSLLPESVKDDPKKFSEALEEARIYARGKAREDLTLKRSGKTTVRNTEHTEIAEDTNEPETELFLDDLSNEGSRNLIKRISERPGPDFNRSDMPPLEDMSVEEAYKRNEFKDISGPRGVQLDETGSWTRGNRLADQTKPGDALGGQRGRK